jgi:PIN domain nuclease of toxin-antitoxin system
LGILEVRLLLDTHAFVWSQAAPKKLGARCRRILEKPGTEISVSAISALELGQLVEAGRLELDVSVDAWMEAALAALPALCIPMTAELAAGAYDLPGAFHRDPADRVLVATARALELTLVTADERILSYAAVKTLDATA